LYGWFADHVCQVPFFSKDGSLKPFIISRPVLAKDVKETLKLGPADPFVTR
jgi:hypothetical protein